MENDCDANVEDKVIAKRAVTLIVAHARKGLVSLCCAVADLLKENVRLERRLHTFQQQLHCNERMQKQDSVSSMKKLCHSTEQNSYCIQTRSVGTQCVCHELADVDYGCSTENHGKELKECDVYVDSETGSQVSLNNPLLSPSPLFGCICSNCDVAIKADCLRNGGCAEVFMLTRGGNRILDVDDRVMIPGNRVGIVKYIGHLDGISRPNMVYAGIQVDDQRGNTDGVFEMRRYFICRSNCGIFLPVHRILFIIEHADKSIGKLDKHALA